MRQMIRLGMGLGVVALFRFCQRAIADDRRRRAKAERREIMIWEHEGGALNPPAQPPRVERSSL